MTTFHIILISIPITLFFIFILEIGGKRLATRRREEYDEVFKTIEKAKIDMMKRLQEKHDKDVRSLYPIGSLIPPRNRDSDDTGPR